MNNFLFRKEFYETRYNCSAYTQEQWQSLGNKRPFIGACFVVIGVCTQAIYILFLIAMMKKRFRSLSCYKIMFFLGIVDMGNIVGGAFGTGYLTWVGAVYCTHPTLIYFIGANGVSCWCTACLTCCLLAFNRCIDFTRADLSDWMFAGNKTWAWLTIPSLYYILIFTFEMPVIYDSNYVTWFYDPFFAVPIHYDYVYLNRTHFINNICVIFVLGAENAFLCYYIIKLSGHISSSNKRKKQFIIQTLIICGLVIFTAIVFVYMNYFYMPPWLTMVSTLAYVANAGSPAFTYLFLNKNLRDASLGLVLGRYRQVSYTSQVSNISNITINFNISNYQKTSLFARPISDVA